MVICLKGDNLMKHNKLLLIILSAYLLTGCSQKNQDVSYKIKSGVIQSDNVVYEKEIMEEVESNFSVEESIKEDINKVKDIDSSIEVSENQKVPTKVPTKIKSEKIQKDPNSIYFRFDEYELSFDFNQDKEELERLKNQMIRFNGEGKDSVSIEGNTDLQGTDEYNYALGIKRANFIKELIKINTSILDKNIKLISYGENNPVCKKNTKECHSKNRRVEIK